MFERFTDRARLCMAYANQEAIRLRGNIIGDTDILLGLLQLHQSMATGALQRLGVDFGALRHELERQPRTDTEGSALNRLPQTPDAKRVIETAIIISDELGSNYVGSEHILLAIVRIPELTASKFLHARGISEQEVKAALLALNDPPDPDGWIAPP